MFLNNSPPLHHHRRFFRKWWKKASPSSCLAPAGRSFRSEAALDALRRAAVHGASPSSSSDGGGGGGGDDNMEEGRLASSNNNNNKSLALYNYPSFSGAFAALFARLYHSRLRLPFLVLPFSSVEPFRVEDLKLEGWETCYLLDFIGPKCFAVELARIFPKVMAFDHRKSTLTRISQIGCVPENLKLHINTEKSSACAVYDYFSEKLSKQKSLVENPGSLLNREDEQRVGNVLRYTEDADLCRWDLPDIKAFNIGLREERSKLNCVTNPYVFEQDAAKKLLGKAFKIRLGRGFYGECLGIRADGHSNLSHEIGDELSKRSAAAGLRPIGAVVFMQRGNLKMCLRSTDSAIDTSEVAKAYGGGGKSSSSSFIIRMDEYNHWTPANSS